MVVGFILFQNNNTVGEELEKEGIADQIQTDIFQRGTLRDDYLLHRDERPLIQLQVVSKNYDQLLGQAPQMFTSVEEQASIKTLADNKKFIDQALSQIIANSQNNNSLADLGVSTGLPPTASTTSPQVASAELEQQLIGQILIKSQDNVTIAEQLEIVSRKSVTTDQQRTVLFVFILIFGLSLIIIIALYFIWGSIGRPLLVLKEAAVRIAALDFATTTTTTTTGGGELGEVGRVFNIMVGKLKESYASLKNANIATQNILEDLSIEKSVAEKAKVKDEAILSSIGDGIIATGSDRRIIVMNKKAEELLGWKIDEAIGKFYDDVILLEDEKGTFVPPKNKPLHKAFEKLIVIKTAGLYLVSKNKIKFPVAITVSPIILDNKAIGAVEVFRDITKEKETDRAKTEFVSLASHQLKTPPTAIKLLTERILNGRVGKLTKKQKEYMGDIRSSNQRMIDLVNTLLSVSRIEMGTFTIEPSMKDVCTIVRNIISEFTPAINNKKLRVQQEFPKEGIMALIDETLFHMVINNLVTNAINYTPEGGRLTVECKKVDKGQTLGGKPLTEDCFAVVITDTGYGIPEKQQDKIFTKFFRADNARGKYTDGNGLGLYIVKSVLDNSGGLIWFNSEENKGTTFYVVIPLTGMKAKTGTTKIGN